MKKLFYLLPLVMFFFVVSCEKHDIVPHDETAITNISILRKVSVQEEQKIEVTIQKATPCHVLSETEVTVSGNVYSYNFIVEGQDRPCTTVVAREVVAVVFGPSVAGEYTLKFLINGDLFETRTVKVTE